MAMYLFASRISAAVCLPSTPRARRPDDQMESRNRGRPVCLLQSKKAKSQRKVEVVLPVTEVSPSPGQPPPYRETVMVMGEMQEQVPLVRVEGHLVSGALMVLVGLLVPTPEDASHPDRGFMFAFLLSSRLFLRPHDLLSHVLSSSTQVTSDKEGMVRVILPVVMLLAEWTEMFPYDFLDDRMLEAVRGLMQGCDCVPQVCDDVAVILQNLLKRLTTLERFETQLASLHINFVTDDRNKLPSTDSMLVCGSPSVLAQQLTTIELERMSYIGPEEFVQEFMRDTSHPLYQEKKTNNMESYMAWTNRLSQLVITEICRLNAKKSRVQMAEFWIDTAKECFNIGNFNSLAAILTGLSSSPVARLSWTCKRAAGEQLTVLRRAMSSASDHHHYRATLQAAVWRSSGTSGYNVVVPLFDLFVKDIYNQASFCSKTLKNGHINMAASWQLAKSLTDFVSWQQVVPPFNRCPVTNSYLQTSPVLSQQAAMLSSFECEGPTTAQEKMQYTLLKQISSRSPSAPTT